MPKVNRCIFPEPEYIIQLVKSGQSQSIVYITTGARAYQQLSIPEFQSPKMRARSHSVDGSYARVESTALLSDPIEMIQTEHGRDLDSVLERGIDESTGLSQSFNEDVRTRNRCVAAIIVGAIFTIACFVLAILIWSGHRDTNLLYRVNLSKSDVEWGTEVISLTITTGITILLEPLSYVHAVSLRWALYREGRLQYNTNLRLFAAANRSRPNQWYTNLSSAICLILSYGATSLLLVKNTPKADTEWSPDQPLSDFDSTATYVNSIALFCLGIGLLGHVVIAAWCLWPSASYIPTWNSDPLNNTLAVLKGNIESRPGRCLMSAAERCSPTAPTKPRMLQPSFQSTSASAGHLTIFMWIITILAAGWSISMALVARKYAVEGGGYGSSWTLKGSFTWTYKPYENLNTYPIMMNPAGYSTGPNIALGWQLFCAILFLCVVQGVQTLGLHCAELIVNVTRDEKIWRKTNAHPNHHKVLRKLIDNSTDGQSIGRTALTTALHSWEYAILFCFKTALPWIMGQAFSLQVSTYDNDGPPIMVQFAMLYPRLVIYTILAFVLALFITYLAFRRPQGPQPATWGHIQTLADLIDDWSLDGNRCFWWGDKGVNDDKIRHAGASSDKQSLGEMQLNALYANRK
ncbi:unnamed protein product [Periconia digitata]|uniref:Uncharacterized protein n=1 Tax=Periconia digitata TaxID=1303443 RepID=A0A9W4XXH4_9PLEO|nr:unnamed protein product [Periconia digitata]